MSTVVTRVWFHTPGSRSEVTPLATITVADIASVVEVRKIRQQMRWAYRRARGPRRTGTIRHDAREAAVGAALMATPCTSIDWAYVRRPSLACPDEVQP